MAGGPAASGAGIGATAPKVCVKFPVSFIFLLIIVVILEQNRWYYHDLLFSLWWYPLRL